MNSLNFASIELASNVLNDRPVHDLMQGCTLHSLLGGSAFNNNWLANGGMIHGPGNGTRDSVAAVTNGKPVAVSNSEFRIPAAVVQALGQDFVDELVRNYH